MIVQLICHLDACAAQSWYSVVTAGRRNLRCVHQADPCYHVRPSTPNDLLEFHFR